MIIIACIVHFNDRSVFREGRSKPMWLDPNISISKIYAATHKNEKNCVRRIRFIKNEEEKCGIGIFSKEI